MTPAGPFTVLIVDADVAAVERLRRTLAGCDARPEALTILDAGDEQTALAAALGSAIDAIVFALPDDQDQARSAMARLVSAAPDAPIIIAADAAREASAFHLMQAGAQGYILTGVDSGHTMWRVIRQAVERETRARRREAALAREHAARLAAEKAFRAADLARANAEAVERRATFLSEASAELSTTLDPSAALEIATRLVVPTLAEGAAAFIANDDGDLEPVASVTRDGAPCAPALAAVRTLARQENVSTLLARARRRGYVVLDSAVTGPLRVTDVVAEATHACVLIPLRARGRVVGMLALLMCPGRPHDTAADLALAQVFAARVAAAVDNACLYEASRRATRTRDQVLGIVSHDLRNPLSAINLCANALTSDDELGVDEQRRLVSTIRDAVSWMQRLLGDLVDVAAIEAGRLSMNPHRVDPIVLLGRSLDLFEHGPNGVTVQLAPDAPEWLPAIAGDEERILQVLANLISNARKVTAPGGSITLGAGLADGAVRFTVADEGPGIAAEHRERIFDWFWRASHERAERGTGLGLAIAKGIVDAHGGRIEVESTPGHGATFSFTIPTSRSTGAGEPVAAAARAFA
jgi:signal transduction histidine kinase/DNA-binding NarL/FixJ family response regulator